MKIRELDPIEQRVSGSLLEKALATPEYYPLTLKALVAACNQKTNREPVTAYTQDQVADALDSLRRDVLAWRKEGPRATKWETMIGRRLELDEAALPIITLLLLRGPQTPGELRSRSGRMHEYDGLPEIERILRSLTQGDHPLVVELARAPGQKESRWMHLIGGEVNVEQALPPTVAASPARDSLASRVAQLEGQVENLQAELTRLVTALEG